MSDYGRKWELHRQRRMNTWKSYRRVGVLMQVLANKHLDGELEHAAVIGAELELAKRQLLQCQEDEKRSEELLNKQDD